MAVALVLCFSHIEACQDSLLCIVPCLVILSLRNWMRINSFTVMIRKAIHIPNNRSTVCYLLYVRVSLRQTNVFPIPFCGRAVSPKDIQLTNFTFKSVPSAINAPPDRTLFPDGVHVQAGGFEKCPKMLFAFYR